MRNNIAEGVSVESVRDRSAMATANSCLSVGIIEQGKLAKVFPVTQLADSCSIDNN